MLILLPRARAGVSSGGSFSPLFQTDFEGASLPSWFDAYGGGSISTEQAYSGTKSAKCSVTSGSADLNYLAGRPSVNLGEGQEIWVRFRTFFPTGYSFSASPHLKFFRIDQGPGSGVNKGHGAHIDWYIRFVGQAGDTNNVGYLDYIQENQQSWLYDTTTLPSGIVRNTWQTWNFYYKLHSVAASGRIRLWRDSTLLVDVNSRVTLGSSTNVIGSTADANAQGIMFQTYWNGGAPQTQSCYIDDWCVATQASPPTNTDSGGNLFIGV